MTTPMSTTLVATSLLVFVLATFWTMYVSYEVYFSGKTRRLSRPYFFELLVMNMLLFPIALVLSANSGYLRDRFRKTKRQRP